MLNDPIPEVWQHLDSTDLPRLDVVVPIPYELPCGGEAQPSRYRNHSSLKSVAIALYSLQDILQYIWNSIFCGLYMEFMMSLSFEN